MPDDCLTSCKYDRNLTHKSGGILIRCMLCVRWYHTKCVDVPKEEATGVWTCSGCRELIFGINIIRTEVFRIAAVCDQLVSSRTADVDDRETLQLKVELSLCKKELEKKTSENMALRLELENFRLNQHHGSSNESQMVQMTSDTMQQHGNGTSNKTYTYVEAARNPDLRGQRTGGHRPQVAPHAPDGSGHRHRRAAGR